MKIQIFLNEKDILSESMLRKALLHREKGEYGAFWLIEGEPILALFVNGNHACLYYMPESGLDKWSSNTEFKGTEEDTIGFLIENYQLDDIAKSVVIPTNKAIEAFVHYYNTKKLSNEISWA